MTLIGFVIAVFARRVGPVLLLTTSPRYVIMTLIALICYLSVHGVGPVLFLNYVTEIWDNLLVFCV